MNMNTKVKPIPEGFHTVTPYLHIRGASSAVDFYRRAFGAQERFRMPGPDGKTVGHAELVIGDSIVMLADEFPQCGNQSPQALQGPSVGLALYVEDVDATFKRAVEAGATIKYPLENKFYGDRSATVIDPFGHIWTIMTHVEDVSPEETQRRLGAEYAKMAGASNNSANASNPPK